MTPMTLAEVATVVGGDLIGDGSALVTAVDVDSRRAAPGLLFAALPGAHVDGHDFVEAALAAGAAGALVSRAVPAAAGGLVVVDDVLTALSGLARHQVDTSSAVVIGVTGSQGKTGVKDLLAHILSGVAATVAPHGSFNNELGVPLTVLRSTAETRYLVVEMGARGIGHIAHLCGIAPPSVGVVLNVGTAHVGEFGSPEAIAVAKGELVEALAADGVAVLNADDARVRAMASRTRARTLTFGERGDVAVSALRLDEHGEPRFTLTYDDESFAVHVPQVGRHVAFNAAAAAAAAVAAGVGLDVVVERLASAVAGSPMRMERHVRADGVTVVNDAYNANPESMTAALEAVAELPAGRRIAVLGEMLELGESSAAAHRDVGRLASALGFDRVVAVGEGAAPIAEGAGDVGESAPDVDVAVSTLSAWLAPSDVVLVKASRGCRLERVAEALLAGKGPMAR